VDDKNGLYKVVRAFAVGSTMIFQFAAALVLGILGGRYLDGLWGTGPWMSLLGLLVGLASGMIIIYRAVHWFWPPDRADKNDRS
jgi:F0F1-type ATP synthase assembly protein I